MSGYIKISSEPEATDRTLWLGHNTTICVQEFLLRYRGQFPVLTTDAELTSALLSAGCGYLYLNRCSATVRLATARLILEGSKAEHEFWLTWDGSLRGPIARNDFEKVGNEIIASLKEAEERRNLLTPQQRLCAALRFRAADCMNDYLLSQGIKPHELSRIKERIDRGEWPLSFLDHLPEMKRYFMQRMFERER